MSDTTKRTVTGSCHCKHISYKVDIPANLENMIKCNCTMCQKPGFVGLNIDSSGAHFHLLSPSSASEVGDYTWRNPNVHRYFCQKCGVQVWCQGSYDRDGKHFRLFMVNLHTVDQPQEGFDLSALKPKYIDGLTDSQFAGTKDTPYPGGLV